MCTGYKSLTAYRSVGVNWGFFSDVNFRFHPFELKIKSEKEIKIQKYERYLIQNIYSADRLCTHSILNFQYHNETTRLSEHIDQELMVVFGSE
jgi:hypothetical protein